MEYIDYNTGAVGIRIDGGALTNISSLNREAGSDDGGNNGGNSGPLAGVDNGQYAQNNNQVVLRKMNDNQSCKVNNPSGVKCVDEGDISQNFYNTLRAAWNGVREC